MEIVIFWLAFSVLCGILAASRGRHGFGYFLLALLITPLLCGLLLLILGRAKDDSPLPNAPTPETHVKCPDCRELVLKEARVCKHCGCRLVPQ